MCCIIGKLPYLVGSSRQKRLRFGFPPAVGALKFNMDGATREKPDLASIGGVLRNSEGFVSGMFSKHIGSRESNEAEVLANLEAIWMFASSSLTSRLVVESDSLNAISWVLSSAARPWRFQFYLNEIRALSSLIQVSFQHVGRSTNGFVDSLAKQGVHVSSNLVAFTMIFFFLFFFFLCRTIGTMLLYHCTRLCFCVNIISRYQKKAKFAPSKI